MRWKTYATHLTRIGMFMLLFSGAMYASAAAGEAQTSIARVAGVNALPIFRPVLPKLTRSHVPVYLPSWLPRMKGPLYPFASVSRLKIDGGGGYDYLYEVDLSVDRTSPCNACNAFFIMGSTMDIQLTPQSHPVPLGSGRWGYLAYYQGTMHEQFMWYIGNYSYGIRCDCTDAQYARIARSVVRVRP